MLVFCRKLSMCGRKSVMLLELSLGLIKSKTEAGLESSIFHHSHVGDM